MFKLLAYCLTGRFEYSTIISIILAVYCKTSVPELYRDAISYLISMKGKWLDMMLQQNNSYEFAKFIMNNACECLSEDEKEKLREIIKIRENLKKV